MKDDHYLIKEAAAKVGVETHVLRYWEEELKMDIHRNDLGHRYYTEKNIEALKKVKELKNRGLQLKAIRNYLEMRKKQLSETDEQEPVVVDTKPEEQDNQIVPVKTSSLDNEEKMEQFQKLMNKIVADAIAENNELIGKSAGEHAANAVASQINGMTKEQEERAEERFKKLDQTLREIQKARQEAAATHMRPVDKRRQARLKRNGNQKNKKEEHKEAEANV
ncbi:MAG: helix-turn-helix domain-containing protein [Lachnospiraceae bacterium]